MEASSTPENDGSLSMYSGPCSAIIPGQKFKTSSARLLGSYANAPESVI
jgi:hypothetical protein